MLVYNNDQIKNKTFYFLLLLLFFKIIATQIIGGGRLPTTTPTTKKRVDTENLIIYISKFRQFNSTKVIDETHLLNNIRILGHHPYRYISFGTFSSGDMLVETTSCQGSTIRVFYGLSQNGRPFFKNKTNSEETHFYSINTSTTNGQCEIESSIIKSSEPENFGKEYFFSLTKSDGYAELFDFDNEIAHSKLLTEFTNNMGIKSIRHAIVSMYNTDLDNFYLFGYLISSSSFVVQKHSFKYHISI